MKNYQILQTNGISALAFSKNGAYCAIATKKNIKLYIFEIKTFNDINTWTLIQQIKDHGQTISDIDWSSDQKIVSVSHDRSVFVWKKNQIKWQIMFAKIDVKLSIMSVKWAPSCLKFAMAACPNTLIISCYFPQTQCWIAPMAKQKLSKSPIISLDFHPSNNVVAVGQISGSVKLISCSLKKNIQLKDAENYNYSGPFQKVDSLGQVLFSIDNVFTNMNIWINSVSFQNNGKQLLVVTHSSHTKLFDVVQGEKNLINQKDISHRGLPFINGILNVQKGELALAGYDRKVAIFNKSGQSYKFGKYLETNEKTNKKKTKGIVEMFSKGIQKKQWQFGDHPKEDQHRNIIKVYKVRNSYVSYDINGIIHFWQ